jgi:hypothetical protein
MSKMPTTTNVKRQSASVPMLLFALACIFTAMNVVSIMPWSSSLEYYKELYNAAMTATQNAQQPNLGKRAMAAAEETDDETDDNGAVSADENAEMEDKEPSSLLWKNTANREHDQLSVPDDDEYLKVMQRIRQLNDCSMSPECRNAHSFEKLPQPVLNTAFYRGQGMGRMLAMAAQTCLVAATVGRPCVVDQTIRDPHYTFRSFVESTLDVDINAMVRLYEKNYTHTRPLFSEETVREAKKAISLLPNLADGSWPKESLEGHTFDHVLPLGNKEATGDPYQALVDHPDKLALSPNWGDSWFSKHEWKWPCLLPNSKTATEGERACKSIFEPRLSSLMQNYMWRPTALSYGLHKLHRQLVLGGKGDDENGVETHNDSSDEDKEEYGAIHLRFVLWKTVDPKNEEQLRSKAQKLHDCLQYWQEEIPSVKKWWLVADMMEPASKLVDFINQQAANSTAETQKVQVFMENGWPEKTMTQKRGNKRAEAEITAQSVLKRIVSHRVGGALSHSLTKDTTGPLGHEHLASSMMDWMVLHESKIAIITAGAFGNTGANGNAKYYHPAASQRENDSCERLLVHRH